MIGNMMIDDPKPIIASIDPVFHSADFGA